MENSGITADIVLHSERGVFNPNLRNASSEQLVVEGIKDTRKIYEKLHDPELMSLLNIRRVVEFVEKETGQNVTSDIFVLNSKDKTGLINDKSINNDKYNEGFNAMYDNLTNSAVIEHGVDKNAVMTESILVHELGHASGIRIININTVGKDAKYQNERMGLRTDNSHGSFMEEMFVSSIQKRYFEKFVDPNYFKIISKLIKIHVSTFDDMNGITFNYPNSKTEGITPAEIPLRYIRIDGDELVAGQGAIAAYCFDILANTIYKKSGEDLKSLMMEARRDPHKIKSLANIIDTNMGKGTFQTLRATTYGNDEDLNSIMTTVKMITSKSIT